MPAPADYARHPRPKNVLSSQNRAGQGRESGIFVCLPGPVAVHARERTVVSPVSPPDKVTNFVLAKPKRYVPDAAAGRGVNKNSGRASKSFLLRPRPPAAARAFDAGCNGGVPDARSRRVAADRGRRQCAEGAPGDREHSADAGARSKARAGEVRFHPDTCPKRIPRPVAAACGGRRAGSVRRASGARTGGAVCRRHPAHSAGPEASPLNTAKGGKIPVWRVVPGWSSRTFASNPNHRYKPRRVWASLQKKNPPQAGLGARPAHTRRGDRRAAPAAGRNGRGEPATPGSSTTKGAAEGSDPACVAQPAAGSRPSRPRPPHEPERASGGATAAAEERSQQAAGVPQRSFAGRRGCLQFGDSLSGWIQSKDNVPMNALPSVPSTLLLDSSFWLFTVRGFDEFATCIVTFKRNRIG